MRPGVAGEPRIHRAPLTRRARQRKHPLFAQVGQGAGSDRFRSHLCQPIRCSVGFPDQSQRPIPLPDKPGPADQSGLCNPRIGKFGSGVLFRDLSPATQDLCTQGRFPFGARTVAREQSKGADHQHGQNPGHASAAQGFQATFQSSHPANRVAALE